MHIYSGIKKRIAEAESVRIHYVKDGPDNYLLNAKITHYHIFPDYLKYPHIHEGYDLAIGILEKSAKVKGLPISKNSYFSDIDDECAKAGDKIMVTGYPGEKNGYLYYMEGTIKEIISQGKRKIILYDNIHTTPGQSGSSVYLKKRDAWHRIGIHVCFDQSANVNIATAITQDFHDWLETIISIESNKSI